VDIAGNLFIADPYNEVVRKVDTNGIIWTVAGNGDENFSGDGGPAVLASLDDPTGMAVDAAGNLFIADVQNQRIREVDIRGMITTVAGSGGYGYFGDGGPAANASFEYPTEVAVNAAGNLFIADTDNQRIRQVVPFGAAPMLALANLAASDAGSYQVIITTPFARVTSAVATLTVLLPPSITVQPMSQDIIAGSNVTFSLTAAGTAPLAYAWHRGSAAIAGATNSSYTTNGVQLADSGSLFTCVITNAYGCVTSDVAALTVGLPPVIRGQPTNETAQAGTTAGFGLTLTGTGPLSYQWQFDGTNLPAGLIYTVAGNGGYGYSGDGGAATNANLASPSGVAVDASGNLFIVDSDDNVVRKVDTHGVITTVAGNGGYGYFGDGSPATNANLASPSGVAVDASGNLFIADSDNSVVRKVDTNGIITTVAGNGDYGYSGDGGAATTASLETPVGVAVDAFGNLFIADPPAQRIRKVDTKGLIWTVAGKGVYGFSGDGGAAINATFEYPVAVAVDASGNLWIADQDNQRIRKVDTNAIIWTVAGNGEYGFSGDGGAAMNATFEYPAGVVVDAAGNLFIADSNDQRIREVNVLGMITTVAGSGAEAYSDSDGVAATSASLDEPNGVALDAAGNLFIADLDNCLVRKVIPFGPAPALTLAGVAANDAGSYQVIVTSPYGSVTSSVVTLVVVSAPAISSIGHNANGSVTLNLQTTPNFSSRVLASTNLMPPALWLPIFTNANPGPSGQWQYTDTNAANYRLRFYRAATP
jgi:sugar lactone lactonase YvrE